MILTDLRVNTRVRYNPHQSPSDPALHGTYWGLDADLNALVSWDDKPDVLRPTPISFLAEVTP